MDHPCHRCNQPVEDGIPFCSHCGAPQIRVLVPEPLPPPLPSGHEVVQGLSPIAFQATQPISSGLHLRWSHALSPCALAALTAAVLTGLGLNPFVAMPSAGFLAVIFYRQRNPGVTVKAAAGARLGALGGLLWFGLSAILQAILVAILHKGPEIRKDMLDRIQLAASGTSDPQVQAVFDYARTSEGFVMMLLAGLVFIFFASIVLGSLGGALSGFFLSRRERR